MEDKTILTQKVNAAVADIIAHLESLNDSQLHKEKDGKWSIAENIIHLNKSVAPINMALSLPKFSFLAFGKAKESVGYDAIVAKYQEALKNGGKAPGQYEPKKRDKTINKAKLIDSFQNHYKELTKKVNKWSEKDLDTYRLPHPLIGKITVRDMILFTVYHLKHHFASLQAD